jgi:hypothetical protein
MLNGEKKEYRVVRLNKDNLSDLAKLHSAVYGNTVVLPPQYFQEKYDTAYTGTEYVGYIAYNDNLVPVAYYGVIPCFIQHKGFAVLAAQSADTMTNPAYRYKGMFVELSKMTFELCRQLGIQLVFGFPNQNSYHGAVNKLGWKMTEAMDCFLIPVKGLPLESFSHKFSFLKRLYSRYRQRVLKKYATTDKGLRNSVETDGYAGVWRNDEYFRYKRWCGAQVIGIDGSKVWISNKQGLIVGDIEASETETFSVFMDKLERLGRQLGTRQIQFHCSPGTRLHTLFAARYISVPSYPVLFQDFGSVIPPEKIKFTFADVDVF